MRIFTLLVFTISLSFFSCDDRDFIDINDVVGGNLNTSIEGEWLLTTFDFFADPIDFNGDGVAGTDLVEETDCYSNETVTFNSDGTAISTSRSYADISAELVDGTTDEYEYSSECVEEIEVSNFTWVQNGNIITLTDDAGETFDMTLSGNMLTYVLMSGFMAFNEDLEVILDADVTIILTKQ